MLSAIWAELKLRLLVRIGTTMKQACIIVRFATNRFLRLLRNLNLEVAGLASFSRLLTMRSKCWKILLTT